MAVVDPKAVGAGIAAFVEVFVEHPRHEPAFIEQVMGLDEVQECHHITGEFSLLLKIRVRDMEALHQLLIHRINALEGVLSTSKEESFVPTGVEGDVP